MRRKKTGTGLYQIIKRNPFSNKMQERARAKRGFRYGRSRKIDPASCILLGSRLSPLFSHSLFALGDVETPHEEPPVRDYEIALPPSCGVFNLVYYRLRLSFPSPSVSLFLCARRGALPSRFCPKICRSVRHTKFTANKLLFSLDANYSQKQEAYTRFPER